MSRGASALVSVLLLLICGVAACGADPAAIRRDAAAYEQQVRTISLAVSGQLATRASAGSYATPDAAGATTEGYADDLATAAERLGRLAPPEPARAAHDGLVRFYRGFAANMRQLAGQLRAADGERQLSELTRSLNAQLQRAAWQEQQARKAVELALRGPLAGKSQ